jgi:hypothetical protein
MRINQDGSVTLQVSRIQRGEFTLDAQTWRAIQDAAQASGVPVERLLDQATTSARMSEANVTWTDPWSRTEESR